MSCNLFFCRNIQVRLGCKLFFFGPWSKNIHERKCLQVYYFWKSYDAEDNAGVLVVYPSQLPESGLGGSFTCPSTVSWGRPCVNALFLRGVGDDHE